MNKRCAAALLAAVMMITIFTGAIRVSPKRIVILLDGKEFEFQTSADNVGDFLKTSGIKLKDNDYLSHTEVSPVFNNMTIVIKVAKYIRINDNGILYDGFTYAAKVKEALEELGHSLRSGDVSEPPEGAEAYDGMIVTVKRSAVVSQPESTGTCDGMTANNPDVSNPPESTKKYTEIIVKKSDVPNPPKSTEVYTTAPVKNYSTVIFSRDGSTVRLNTYAKTVGEFMREKWLYPNAMQTVSPSEDTTIYEGMKIEFLNSKPAAMSPLNFGVALNGARVLNCTATAYTSAKDETSPYSNGYTASGMKCEVGIVAVDPKVIPLGSRLFIETADGSFVYGYCIAGDTGSAIKGQKVDLVMNTKEECYNFGRRAVKVYILP